jgi:phytoene dehydrogenase-like protein
VSDRSVIIIGAGLGGLAAGCYAQINGYQTHIFEHHSQPGGVAAVWKRGDYLIDGGIHFLMSYEPGTDLYRLYRELGIIPAVSLVELNTYGNFIDEARSIRVKVTRDLDRLATDLKALAPADAKIVDELIGGARAFQGSDMSGVGLSKPPELAGALDQLKVLWTMRSQFRYMMGRYGSSIAEYACSAQMPWLRTFLKYLFVPEAPVYFVMMLLALLADGQLGLIEGGSRDLVRAVERRFKELGGEVTYRARVEEILVESASEWGGSQDRARGVRLANDDQHEAGAVVSAADGYSTIFKMLGGRYVDEKIRKRYETWPRFRPLIMVSYGVAREFPAEPAFATIVLERPLTIARRQVEGIFVRVFNYSRRFAPPAKTVVQVELETEWQYWDDLQREDRSRYEKEKRQVAADLLVRLEAHYPGILAQVEVTDVATPYTFWRYTLNDRGTWGGWLMTPKAIMTFVDRMLPGLADFYMAGQWVMPGGGVPPVLYSGRHVAQLLCHRDGQPFVTNTS